MTRVGRRFENQGIARAPLSHGWIVTEEAISLILFSIDKAMQAGLSEAT